MAGKSENLTARRVRDFIAGAETRDLLWHSKHSGLHIIKLKSGGSWRLEYRDIAGKSRRITVGRYPSMTLEKAEEIAAGMKVIIAQGGDPLKDKAEARQEALRSDEKTIKAYLDGPYTQAQKRKKSGAGTLSIIRRNFTKWLDRPMHSLSRGDVVTWQAECEERGLAFPTIKRTLGALQTMLNHAAKHEVIESNPIKGVALEAPAMTEEELAEASQRRYLEAEEVTALFAAMDEYQEQKRAERRSSRAHGKPFLPDLDSVAYVDHVKPFLMLMFYTGFRPGDLFGLRWEHVNLRFKTITKTIEKTAHHHPAPRSFPVSDNAIDVLATWWEQEGKPKSGYVFTSERTGSRFDRTAMSTPWANIRRFSKALVQKGAISHALPDDLVMYSLRHNFASQLIMDGADLLTVSKLMAHDDINTTIQHYAHLKPDHARDYVNGFGQSHTPEERGKAAPNINEARNG